MMNNKPKTPSIRHCMVVHNSYPFAETRVQRQAEALTAAGHAVDVICLRHSDEPAAETVGGATVYRLPMRRSKSGPLVQMWEYFAFLLAASFKLTGLHFKKRYHTVQLHNLPDFLVFAALVPKLAGARVMLDLHDLMPEFYCAKFNATLASLPVRLIRWQEWLSCRFANHVITVTEAWRQTLIGRGVGPAKCSVVMNLADPRYFNRDVKAGPNGQPGQFSLIYHGTLARRYGLDLLLHALAKLRPELPGLRLIIHGRGEYLEPVRNLIAELSLDDAVELSSAYLPLADLPKRIKAAQAGVVPYRRDVFTDGILPTKLMEYTALGVPAIAARTPGIAAYFDDTMVEFFNAEDVDDLARHIRLLYDNPTRLAELARNTAKFNQKYNWTNQAAEYVRLVETLAHRQDKQP